MTFAPLPLSQKVRHNEKSVWKLCYDCVETGSKPHLQSLANSLKQFKLTKEYEDYELKKTLICILTTLSSDLTAVKIMASKKVLRSLLSYVVQNDKAPENWSSAQFEELQLMVSAVWPT